MYNDNIHKEILIKTLNLKEKNKDFLRSYEKEISILINERKEIENIYNKMIKE